MSAVAQRAATPPVVKDLYEIGEMPPLGHVPERMHAWAIRPERLGPPDKSMQIEVVPTWPIRDDEG
jgi:crotonyl-CoA carboxylase/reductase